MKVRRILFLSLGLERTYPPEDRKNARDTTEKLSEPDGARICRRNILALAAAVVLAGAVDADPHDLDVFGVKPADDWGVLVLGSVTILAHLYWYVLRYYHLRDEGRIERKQQPMVTMPDNSSIDRADTRLVRRGADLLSNRAAFLLTLLSWWFIASWMAGVPPWQPF